MSNDIMFLWHLKGENRFKGVTLLELMVAVAIISVLLSLGFISFKRLKANYDLTEATNRLYSDIEWLRQKSMGSAHPYGISFSANSYSLFQDADGEKDFDAGEEIEKENLKNIELKKGKRSDPPVPITTPIDVIYSRRGTPNLNSLTITLENKYKNAREVRISKFKTRIFQ